MIFGQGHGNPRGKPLDDVSAPAHKTRLFFPRKIFFPSFVKKLVPETFIGEYEWRKIGKKNLLISGNPKKQLLLANTPQICP